MVISELNYVTKLTLFILVDSLEKEVLNLHGTFLIK